MAKPFLKWAGGKSGLLSQIAPLLPDDLPERVYHEPFLGGGSMFLSQHITQACLSDINAELVTTYLAVRNFPQALIRRLNQLRAEYRRPRCSRDCQIRGDKGEAHRKHVFYETRDRYNEGGSLDIVERAALFIFLNKTCFNGLYRVNKKGKFNVPWGKAKNPAIFGVDEIVQASNALLKANIYYGDYHDVLDRAQRGDFVYFDPPYVPLSESSSFTSYTKGGFGLRDQGELRETFELLDKRGCLVMLSNSSDPLIWELYDGYHFTEISAPRSINANGGGRGNVTELVVRNYESSA